MTQLAQVQYRDYVDRYTFALKFLDIHFSGSEADALSNQWHKMEYQDVPLREELLEQMKAQLESMDGAIDNAERTYAAINRARFNPVNWFNKDFHTKRDDAWNTYQNQIIKKRDLEKAVKDFRVFDDIHQLKDKKNDFLLQNGFTLVTSHFQADKHITVEEWVKKE